MFLDAFSVLDDANARSLTRTLDLCTDEYHQPPNIHFQKQHLNQEGIVSSCVSSRQGYEDNIAWKERIGDLLLASFRLPRCLMMQIVHNDLHLRTRRLVDDLDQEIPTRTIVFVQC